MVGKRIPAVCVLLLLVCAQAAGELAITGPSLATSGQYVTLNISGLAAPELARATVSCSPSEAVSILPATTWGGQPILLFQASRDGKYEVKVSLNQFVRTFMAAKDAAEAAGVDEDTLAAYRSLHTLLVTDYPSALATHTITVGDPKPDPGPDPPPPDKVQILIIEETAERRPPYGDIYIQLRKSDTLRGVDIYIVDRDGKTPDGRPLPNIAGYVAQIKGTLPYMFLIGEVAGTKGKILWQGTCPASYTDVLAVVGRYRKVD